ncbi:DUF2973 domain-containing protein [Spirulina subsalsa FACHB-351]|uniref:DUF2973 domain-containing protein n=1 Tax=Spirulina subsalsa FACHB-351 TaxID=234711 RepID=A0ABT3L4M5_9CYAN|nr:DUF2973 domain-containing protein [Spirulina subsalsa]MCW6036454.1 DUF2973 domain-containing protein [Spirulina subsalsa FACHB-351]
MLHILYILAFTVIAFLAISNLIRSLITVSTESTRRNSPPGRTPVNRTPQRVSHPELLDENGQLTDEPLLIMRSVNVEDAREQLDAIYNASPGTPSDTTEE